MFDKMKELMELQKKAKDMQKKLEVVRVEKKSRGGKVNVVLNGTGKIESIAIDESALTPSLKKDLEEALVDVLNEAYEDAQKQSASQAMDLMKGLDLPKF
jgi:DNA-binding YbaB/EbfC family protein